MMVREDADAPPNANLLIKLNVFNKQKRMEISCGKGNASSSKQTSVVCAAQAASAVQLLLAIVILLPAGRPATSFTPQACVWMEFLMGFSHDSTWMGGNGGGGRTCHKVTIDKSKGRGPADARPASW
jgi:hypothetical protein